MQHRVIYVFHEAFADVQHVLNVHEGHFQVNLGEFRLPVGPQILVPETSGQLDIPVKSRHHAELLVQLGRLGKGIEIARMHPGGHQKVPGSLRCGLNEYVLT